jgi:carbon storage regulator
MIGDDIEVTVLQVMGEKVRIGIEAPRSIPVFRQEVYLDIQRDRAEVADDPHAEKEVVEKALQGLKSAE